MPERAASISAWRLASELAGADNEPQAAAAVARAAAVLGGAEQVRVWMIDRHVGYRFSGSWPEENARPSAVPSEVPRAVVFSTAVVAAAPSPFRSRLVVPLLTGLRPLGAVEMLESERIAGAFTAADVSLLSGLLEAADVALPAIRDRALRESGRLEVILRLTRLFDAGRTFARTLEESELRSLVADRVRASLDVESAYLWLLDDAGENLVVAGASGPQAGQAAGWRVAVDAAEGAAAAVAVSGKGRLFDDPADLPGVEHRPDVAAGLAIQSAAAAPLISREGKALGVIEVVNKLDVPLDRDDLAFLVELADNAAIALTNARRLDAERKASDLGSLLATAQVLSQSLDVQKVTYSLVHQAASVIRYKRAAVALVHGARVDLAAVSGKTFVDDTVPGIKALRALLSWAAGLDEGIYVNQEEDGTIDAERPETREKFRHYFDVTGSRSYLAVPLTDDVGHVGVLGFEAAESYAFSDRDMEAAGLLAVQATLAIRNATLFQQIPMARIFQPLARRMERLLSQSWSRLLAMAGASAAVLAALALIHVPLRVSGDARVLSERRLPVTAEVEGRIASVLVREGDPVREGQLVAFLDDGDARAAREDAWARYQVAEREQSRLRAGGEAAGAAVEGARLDGLRAELALWEARLAKTRVRSTVTGIVASPRVEELAGARVARGDVVCEVVEPGRLRIEVAVPERDAGLVRAGMPVKVKLYAYPTVTFPAEVERVGVAATPAGDETVLLVRARLLEPATLRSGMTGRAKISTGPASLGRVLFRSPGHWAWNMIWGWLP